MEDVNGQFSTKDTSLAAYLYTEGFELLDVNIDGFPSVFIFENNGRLLQCVHDFQIGKAITNASLYHEAYRKCLRMTKVGKL